MVAGSLARIEAVASIRIKRIYEEPAASDGLRVLVDGIWPRGVSKEKAAIDLWAKEIAPSAGLRQWYGHDPRRWPEFRRRYRAELAGRAEQLRALRDLSRRRRLTLLFSARDADHNQAVVVKEVLETTARRSARAPAEMSNGSC